MNAVAEKVKMIIGSQEISFLLEVTSDGSISALSIRQSSGSEDIDKKGLELVKSAAPFIKGENTKNKKYLVELPELSVKPYVSEATNH